MTTNPRPEVWLEVALNGPWTRSRQPGIPVSADEICEAAVACADEGAAIVHFHAYDEATGRQRDAYEIYAPIIERIRARADVVCYPTLPLTARADEMSAAKRFEAVERLAREGLIEWTVLDTGSTHLVTFDQIARGDDGFLYANSDADRRYGMDLAARHGIVPSFAIYEPGFLRAGAALERAHPKGPRPVYRFMFSDQFAFGLPPATWALETYLKLLDLEAPGARWMVAGLGVDLEVLLPLVVARGGHYRVGLEDAPLGCALTNAELVRRAASSIERLGARVASAESVRAAIAPNPRG